MKVFIAHSHHNREIVITLGNLLREDGHEVILATEISAGENVLSTISAAIRSADVLVAIVTGGNQNVFYELGLAAGASVPILITATANELLPADLASVPYVQLTGDVLRDAQKIARRAKDLQGSASTKMTKFESAEGALQAAIRDPAILESISPVDFERLVTELFKERGYAVSAGRSTKYSGADFSIKSRKDQELVVVEVKKLSRQSRVSVEAVRRLLSAVSIMGASLGVIVATSGYTAAALALATGTPILLRTLEEVLAAKSEKDLLESMPNGDIVARAEKTSLPWLHEPIPLTNRELEVLELLSERLSNKEIADRLFITQGTTKAHLKKIYEKLEVSNRSQALSVSKKHGIITKNLNG